jgi:hypothetical protein
LSGRPSTRTGLLSVSLFEYKNPAFDKLIDDE